MPKPRKIAVLIEWSRAYGRGAYSGIARYVNAHRTWKIYYTERGLSDEAPSWLQGWKGDGIIARIESNQLYKQVQRMKIPAVNMFEHSRSRKRNIPEVITNNRAIANMAAQHLIDLGLENFAYCGLPGVFSRDARSGYFVEYIQKSGYEVNVYEGSQQPRNNFISTAEDHELCCEDAMATWLDSLPKPVGLMACNDLRAHQVIMACGERNIIVPDDVAVIGVDNDELICELCHPPLSSVQQNPEGAGYEAATLLDKILDGHSPPEDPIIIEPLGIVRRQSTDIIAVNDSEVAAAIRYIRANACDGICVNDILDNIHTSRSTLERRFNKLLGRSPKVEILRTQLEQVKQLLLTTDYPLEKISQMTGFSYTESMCYSFKRTFGQTPGQYRNESTQ